MAFTTAEKVRLMQGDGLYQANDSLFVALGIGTTELNGNGYSRGEVTFANLMLAVATGVLTLASGIEIYTANTDTAQDSTHMRIYRSAAGGNADAVTDWEPHNDIAAPINGQAVNTGTITITP